MRRLFVPTFGPSDWRRLLADPEKQWRSAKSAYESAVAWEAARSDARGLPPDVAGLLDTHEAFRGATLLLGIPEHQVPLDGGGHASQTDFWALLDAPIGVTSVAVEAKAGENKIMSPFFAVLIASSTHSFNVSFSIPLTLPFIFSVPLSFSITTALQCFGISATNLLISSPLSVPPMIKTTRGFCRSLAPTDPAKRFERSDSRIRCRRIIVVINLYAPNSAQILQTT